MKNEEKNYLQQFALYFRFPPLMSCIQIAIQLQLALQHQMPNNVLSIEHNLSYYESLANFM